ncbi:MAG TPA: hypothetical protein VN228_00950 [Pyrinomonadaceae bacterium]|nr:hypothetical protein [Pyrinomonadaceae bacterium]
MKNSRTTLLLLLLLAGASPAAAQNAESLYTDLDPAKCKTVEFEHEGYSWTKECRGVAGYKLRHLQGDERESITVVAPGGAEHPLEFWSTVTPAFSSVGPRAEWRVRRRGDRVEPFALIVRLNANENPVEYQKVTSYLVVARLAPGKVCVTDRVAPGPRANELARQSADASAAKPCLRPIGETEAQ